MEEGDAEEAAVRTPAFCHLLPTHLPTYLPTYLPTHLRPPSSYLGPSTSDLLPPTSDLLFPTSYLLPPTSYLRPPTSYFLPPTSCPRQVRTPADVHVATYLWQQRWTWGLPSARAAEALLPKLVEARRAEGWW